MTRQYSLRILAASVLGSVVAAVGKPRVPSSPESGQPASTIAREPRGPASRDSVVLFQDDFSSGDLSKRDRGWSWAPVWVDVVRGFSRRGTVGNSARFTYHGAASADEDAWSELRFTVGTQRLSNVWVTFWLYYPSGAEVVFRGPKFVHRNVAPSNNKFFRIFDRYDVNYLMYGAHTWTDSGTRAGDGFLTPDRRDQSGLTQHYWDVKVPWEADPYRGRWIKVEVHAAAPSKPGAADGVLQFFRDGVIVFGRQDIDGWQRLGDNVWKEGYILGWANSGFRVTTYAYISDISFSRARL